MVFIHETKCSMHKIREIDNKWLIKYEYLEVKEKKLVGGILTLRDPQNFGTLDAEASRNYLSLVCQPLGDKEIYKITNVYGTQKEKEKFKLLTSLKELKARYPNIPSIIAGDFNMIRSLTEKKGGIRQLGRDSITFQNFIMNMGLVDTKTINGTFTCNNKRGGLLRGTLSLRPYHDSFYSSLWRFGSLACTPQSHFYGYTKKQTFQV